MMHVCILLCLLGPCAVRGLLRADPPSKKSYELSTLKIQKPGSLNFVALLVCDVLQEEYKIYIVIN